MTSDYTTTRDTAVAETLAAIDEAVRDLCGWCGEPLPPDAPSQDFHPPEYDTSGVEIRDCQRAWHQALADAPRDVLDRPAAVLHDVMPLSDPVQDFRQRWVAELFALPVEVVGTWVDEAHRFNHGAPVRPLDQWSITYRRPGADPVTAHDHTHCQAHADCCYCRGASVCVSVPSPLEHWAATYRDGVELTAWQRHLLRVYDFTPPRLSGLIRRLTRRTQ